MQLPKYSKYTWEFNIWQILCFYNLEVIWLQKNVKMPAYENSHKKSQKINRKLEKKFTIEITDEGLIFLIHF